MRARHFAQRSRRLGKMLDGDDVQRGVEDRIAERQRGQIGDGIETAVVPRRIAHRQIDAAVALAREFVGVLSFARAGVEHARAGRKRRGEGAHGVLDLAFEVQNVPPQRPRQAVGDAGVFHWRLRLDHDGGSAARRGFGQRERQSRRRKRQIGEILCETHAAALARCAARGAPWGRATAPGCWRGPRDCRAEKNICAAARGIRTGARSFSRSRAAEIEEMARHVDAVPRAAQQAELP